MATVGSPPKSAPVQLDSRRGLPVSAPKSTRYVELDSLRGLAALVVVLHHLRLLWEGEVQPTSHAIQLINSLVNPAGNGSVILFFVLSGFVLSLPGVAGKPQSYPVFVVRRIFRIYIPYLVALATTVAGAYWLHGIITNSSWFHLAWSQPVHWSLVRQHVMFIGVYNSDQFDGPIWSLVHEMRISLIFPLICAFVLRFRSKWSFAIAFGLTAIAVLIQWPPLSIDWSIAESVHIAGLFVFGIYLAREKNRVCEWFLRWPVKFISVIAATTLSSLALYLLAGPKTGPAIETVFPHLLTCVRHWLIAFSAGGLMIIAISSPLCKRILTWPPIHFLGEISYSLYLWHFIVMMYCVHLLYGKIPFPAILGIILVLSIIVSRCSYLWVEVPAMNLGRKLSNRLA